MTILLSIDGGNRADNDRKCAVSEYHAGMLVELHELNINQARKAIRNGLTCDAVAVERGGYLKANIPPRVIADLCWNTAALAFTLAAGAPVREYTVNDGTAEDWIGGVKKHALHCGIWAALSPAERKVFPADTAEWIKEAVKRAAGRPGARPWEHPAFNSLCSAGVGLFDLGRITKGAALNVPRLRRVK